MQLGYLTALAAAILFFSAGNAWGCLADAQPVGEEDLKYPPADTIAFKAIITNITTHGDLDRGKPHGGFQLKLKIVKVFQGSNLKDSIVVNYGGCHNLPAKQGSVINVLALHSKKEGWYAPQFWWRSNDPNGKKNCVEGKKYYYGHFSSFSRDRIFIPDEKGEAYGCFGGYLIPLGYDPRKFKK